MTRFPESIGIGVVSGVLVEQQRKADNHAGIAIVKIEAEIGVSLGSGLIFKNARFDGDAAGSGSAAQVFLRRINRFGAFLQETGTADSGLGGAFGF